MLAVKNQLCPWDRAVLEKPGSVADMEKAFLEELSEAFRQGSR